MDDLIRALQILRKYGNPKYPTHCEHDTLIIMDIDPDDVSDVDLVELETLGFIVDQDEECYGNSQFISYRFGSA
jgi:hypothetical protein